MTVCWVCLLSLNRGSSCMKLLVIYNRMAPIRESWLTLCTSTSRSGGSNPAIVYLQTNSDKAPLTTSFFFTFFPPKKLLLESREVNASSLRTEMLVSLLCGCFYWRRHGVAQGVLSRWQKWMLKRPTRHARYAWSPSSLSVEISCDSSILLNNLDINW
jgi:hypothetical protein